MRGGSWYVAGDVDPVAIEAAYASDHWQADVLGIDAMRGRSSARFDTIVQPWLRQPVKGWCRWRLATGLAFTSIAVFALAMARFAQFLLAAEPDADGGGVITRALIERYMAWLRPIRAGRQQQGPVAHLPARVPRTQPPSPVARGRPARCRHLPGGPAPAGQAVAPFRAGVRDGPARKRANLALLEPTVRHLVVVLMETGLRASDACTLPFNPILDDSVGWPCLRYHSRKTNTEQLVPLSGRAAVAIRDQQAVVRANWPGASPWLFPGPPWTATAQALQLPLFGARLKSWQRHIGLHDGLACPSMYTPTSSATRSLSPLLFFFEGPEFGGLKGLVPYEYPPLL